MKRESTVLALCCLVLLCAVSGVNAGEINLSAAASLKDSLTEIAKLFTATHPEVKIQPNFGASGALAKQIENGAPADIFISADQKWVGYLTEKNLLVKEATATLAYNTLVFVGGDKGHVASLPEVTKLERVAIGSPASVPAGDYATQALKKAGLDQAMEKKLVMAKDVRECLMYAERGEVDGAFVYQTDAMLAKNVKVLFTVPQDLHARVTYPMAMTLAGEKNEEAKQFMQFLQTAEAKGVLKTYGFALP